MVKTGDLAPRQNGRQPGVLADRKAPPQRLAHQAFHCHRAQVVFFELQQGHGAAAKARAQVADQPLQAHGLGQIGGKVFEEGVVIHGFLFVVIYTLVRLILPKTDRVKNTVFTPSG